VPQLDPRGGCDQGVVGERHSDTFFGFCQPAQKKGDLLG
jgi:hypothetical protein